MLHSYPLTFPLAAAGKLLSGLRNRHWVTWTAKFSYLRSPGLEAGESHNRLRSIVLVHHSHLLPIRTTIDTRKLGVPKRASDNVRQTLIKEAKKWPELPPPHPLTVRATITEKLLPIVSANVMVYGLGSTVTDPYLSLINTEVLWDTGAHSTVIVDELLPQKFKDYLEQPENDCYRSAVGIRVQIDALITFTNQVLALSCVCVVVPRSAVPNRRVGILLGQHMGINRMVYKSVPRAVLSARGESVPETIWGDIMIKEYVDIDNIIQKFGVGIA